MKNKKIAIVMPSFGIIGAQRTAIENGNRLIQLGYDVKWIALESGKITEELSKDNYVILDGLYFRNIRFLRLFISIFRLFLYLKKNKFNITISIAPFLNRVLCFYKKIRLLNSILIIEDHAFPPRSYNDEFKNLWKLFYINTEFLYKYANKIRVLSNECRQYYISKGVNPAKIIFFQNLLNFDRLDSIASEFKIDVEKKRPRLVYIGRYARQKNLLFIIDSFNILRNKIDCELLIIGYGPEKENIIKKINNLKLENDIFLIESSAYNFSYLKTADVFPIASIWEGMVLTMIEAMYFSIPVVSTKFLTGPQYLIGNSNERGWLVEENDILLFAEALYEAIQNKNLAKIRSKFAHDFVVDKFNVKTQFSDYIELFIE